MKLYRALSSESVNLHWSSKATVKNFCAMLHGVPSPQLEYRTVARLSNNFNRLKGFFHGSAHARVLRNLVCVPALNKANFWGFTWRSVEGGFHLGSYFIPAFGFWFYFTVLSLNLSKSYKISNVTYRVKSNIMSDPSKRNHWQKNRSNSNKAQIFADLSDLA